ncbi:MAG TPA: uroporphyrinogen-III C-methyltransferase [Burkholderiaceae bacterium]|nr:uroporphyrinogen-III C-methyltransferase [Burkholderiaceae bacterium]
MNQSSTLGRVVLVGAGPGDPELLTLKAVRAIGEADVVLVDDLVDAAVLAHARPNARIVHVGKRGGCASTPQRFIERLMESEARAGRTVVRLKGGDPFVFGRGGEEKSHLEALGITVEVIPGITSGIAAPSAIGVPVTHRDYAQGCIFVTGHGARKARADDDGAPQIDWAALAATKLTLVVYMGVGRVQAIQAELLAAGLSPTLPVAVIQNATQAHQKHLSTTLRQLAADIQAFGIGSPAVLVIGEVARFADKKRDLARLAEQSVEQAREQRAV